MALVSDNANVAPVLKVELSEETPPLSTRWFHSSYGNHIIWVNAFIIDHVPWYLPLLRNLLLRSQLWFGIESEIVHMEMLSGD